MPERILPLFLDGCQPITEILSYQRKDGTIYYFHGSFPVFNHAQDDSASFKMFTSQLIANGQCRNVDIQRAFGITKISVCRALNKFRKGGSEAFYAPKRVRGAAVLTVDVLSKAQELLDDGVDWRAVADRVNVKRDTLRKAILHGKLHESSQKRGH
jgi:hypothetical protein